MVKPTDIVDNFGDSYLGCPNCKEPVHFPLIRNPQHIFEELADVKLVLDQVIHLIGCEDQVQQVMKQKIERTFERIGEQNAGN